MKRKLTMWILDCLVSFFSIQHPWFSIVVKLGYYILCWVFGVEPEKF